MTEQSVKKQSAKSTKPGTKKVKKKKFEYQESIDALTCSVCKSVFESRNKLFGHIRNEHAKNDK